MALNSQIQRLEAMVCRLGGSILTGEAEWTEEENQTAQEELEGYSTAVKSLTSGPLDPSKFKKVVEVEQKLTSFIRKLHSDASLSSDKAEDLVASAGIQLQVCKHWMYRIVKWEASEYKALCKNFRNAFPSHNNTDRTDVELPDEDDDWIDDIPDNDADIFDEDDDANHPGRGSKPKRRY